MRRSNGDGDRASEGPESTASADGVSSRVCSCHWSRSSEWRRNRCGAVQSDEQDEVQCGPILEVVTRSGVVLAGVSEIGDGRHGGWRSEDEARSGEKRSLWCVKNSAKTLTFLSF